MFSVPDLVDAAVFADVQRLPADLAVLFHRFGAAFRNHPRLASFGTVNNRERGTRGSVGRRSFNWTPASSTNRPGNA
jgi:hypothetical protein